MTNTFLTTQEIARAAMPLLHSNLVFPALCYTNHLSENGKKGDTVQVKKPPIYTASEFSSNIDIQEINESSVLVKLDKIADVSVELSAKEMALNLSDFSKQILEPAALAIAEKINKDGFELYKDIPYACGTAGETPNSLDIFSSATKVLNDQKAPLNERSAVWNSEALAKLQVLPAIVNAEKSGGTKALRDGSIGRIIGIQNYMSQQVCSHLSGNLESTNEIEISEAAVEGDSFVKLKAKSSGSLSGMLVKGDILAIGGKKYVVTENCEVAEGVINPKIYPYIGKEGIAKSTAVLKVANHAANLVFHKNAFGFINRPLEAARGADSYVTSFGGISLRVTVDYDIRTKKQTMSIDTLYGFKTLYPELALRVLG